MAVEKETQLEAWLEENMPEPGGGNPNYVETITGTLTNPWGEANFQELIDGILANELTVEMEVSSVLLSASINNGILFSLAIFDLPSDTDPIMGGSVMYSGADDGALTIAKANFGTGSWVNLPSTMPCTVIIIHHPLPEN